MAKQIKQKDIIVDDVWGKAIKSTEELLNVVNRLDEQLIKLGKDAKKSLNFVESAEFDEIKKLNAEVEKVNKAFESKIKLDKDRVKLEQKLSTLTSEQAKEQAVLRVQIQEQNKLNKEAAKQKLGLISAYQKEAAKLNELRKAQKDLNIQQELGVKLSKEQERELARLTKEVDKYDKALKNVDAKSGQFQRNVGNYPKIVDKARNSFGSLSGFLLGAFAAGFNKSRDTARDFQGVIERTTNVVRVFAASIVTFSQNKAFPTIENLFVNLQVAWLEFKNTFTFGDASDKIEKDIEDLNNKIEENKKVIDESASGFENFGDKINETDKNIVERLKRLDTLADLTARLNKEILNLTGQEAELEIQIGNSSISFARRDELITQLIAIQQKRADLERRLAKEGIENALTSIKNDLIRRDLGDQFNRQQVISLDFLKQKNLADAVGKENLDALIVATEQLTKVEQEQRQNALNSNKERLENARDLFEQELDFTLDIGDRQKSINERIIADEKEVLAERAKRLADTTNLLDDSFKEQIKLTENFIAQSIELNDGLTGEEAKQKVKDLNLERIVGLEDEKQIRQELFNAGITDEITQNRIREIIIERKAAIQDVADAQKDLKEALEEEVDLRAEIEIQQKAINANNLEGFKELEEDKVEIQIENLKRRIENSKDNSLEQLRLRKELNDLLIEEQKKTNDKQAELDKKAQEKLIENREKTLQVTQSLFNRQFEERIRLADQEVEVQKQRQGELQNLAAQGNADAAASLAENQKKQAQAEEQKQELLQKQKQFELALAVVNAFNAELDANPSGGSGAALAKALTSTTVLTSFVSSLPAFKDGTEDTGRGGGLDGYGGFHAILHPNERVLTKEQNSKIGGRKNDEVADIMDNYNKGLLIDLDKHNNPKLKIEAKPYESTEQLLKRFDKMERSIVNAISSKETYLGSDIDTIKQVITKTFKQGNKVVKQNSRSPRI